MKPLYILILVLALVAFIGPVMAVPTTQAATEITNRQVRFNAINGAAGLAKFEWGAHHGGPWFWSTPNATIAGGAYSALQWGPPMQCGATYYYRACDSTGCDPVDVSFTVPACDVMTATDFGAGLSVIRMTGFNITESLPVILDPWENQIGGTVMWGLLFFFIFAGFWMRGKDITIPLMLAFIAGGAIWLGTSALGIPPAFATIGQGLMYAALAGVIFGWFSK